MVEGVGLEPSRSELEILLLRIRSQASAHRIHAWPAAEALDNGRLQHLAGFF